MNLSKHLRKCESTKILRIISDANDVSISSISEYLDFADEVVCDSCNRVFAIFYDLDMCVYEDGEGFFYVCGLGGRSMRQIVLDCECMFKGETVEEYLKAFGLETEDK